MNGPVWGQTDTLSRAEEKELLSVIRAYQKETRAELRYQQKIYRAIDKLAVPGAGTDAIDTDSIQILNASRYKPVADTLDVLIRNIAFRYEADEKEDMVTEVKENLTKLAVLDKQISVGMEALESVRHSKLEKIRKKQQLIRGRMAYLKALNSRYRFLNLSFLDKLSSRPLDQLKLPSVSMGQFRSLEELEKMGFQTKRLVSREMQQSGDMQKVFRENVQNQLEAYMPLDKKDEILSLKDKAKEIFDNRKDWSDIKNPLNAPVRFRPFSHRFSYSYNTSFNRSGVASQSTAGLDANILYSISDHFFTSAGAQADMIWLPPVRHLKYESTRLYLNGAVGFKLASFYTQLLYQHQVLHTALISEKAVDNGRNLFWGLGKTTRLNDKLSYNVFIGYNLLWKTHMVESPWVFRMGIVRN